MLNLDVWSFWQFILAPSWTAWNCQFQCPSAWHDLCFPPKDAIFTAGFTGWDDEPVHARANRAGRTGAGGYGSTRRSLGSTDARRTVDQPRGTARADPGVERGGELSGGGLDVEFSALLDLSQTLADRNTHS